MLPLWIAFFVSGVAGLSYELTWVRHLSHVFGATTPAVAATVAIFFAGTAIGSAVGARVFDRRSAPVRDYARLEALIGLAAIVHAFVLPRLDAVVVAGGAQSIPELIGVCTVVLLVPAALLGATFPAMAAAVRELGNPTRATALLYGLNTLGAVVGCLLVSFWWIPSWGLRTTAFVLAGFNLAIAALVRFAVRPSPRVDDASGGPSPIEVDPVEQLGRRRALGLAAVSGLVAIAIEVQWVRALALSFPATVYVFALVLAAYLVGIGLGAVLVGRWYRHRAPVRLHLSGAYLAAGLGALVALNLLPQIAPWSLATLAGDSIRSWEAYMGWVGGAAFVSMLPATLAMGAALPILIGLGTAQSRHVAASAGTIYGANTIGGVAGSLVGTFVSMPGLGLSRSLAVLSLSYLGLALAVSARGLPARARLGVAALLGIGGLAVALDLQPEVNPLRDRPGSTLVHYADTPSATIAVYEDDAGVRTLTVNNQYTLSETSPPTVALQYRLGAIPMKLHPAPQRVLLVGFATGTTLAAMAEHPAVRQLHCVELHDAIFALAPLFSPANRDVQSAPTVHLIEGDGRRYLAREGPAFDVIVSDLFVPRNPGVGALYSREHFEAVARRLAPDGVFVTWLPLWQLGPDELASVVRTFSTVFPEGEAYDGNWTSGSPVLGLVATGPTAAPRPEALEVDVSSLMRAAFGPRAAAEPANRHVARRRLDARGLAALADDAPLNTLDHPVVEYGAPRATMRARVAGRPIAQVNLARLAELGATDP